MTQSIKDKVKALERTNRLVTENLVDAVWVVDTATLKYEYITPSIQKISGYSAEELIGRTIVDRMTPATSKKAKVLLDQALKDYADAKLTSRTAELELKQKNGDTYWVEIRAKLTEAPDGPPKIIGITRDITERKKAELELRRLNKQLTAALADKAQLAKEVKLLRELLPICSGCRRIRDDDGRWWPLDEFIRSHTDSDFTHTICPDCQDIFYPGSKDRT